MKRQRRDRAEMESLLAKRAAAGLTYQQLADESGIPMSTIAAWGRKLRKSTQVDFVELQVEEARSEAAIWIETRSGHRVHVAPGFDEATLSRVLQTLPC